MNSGARAQSVALEQQCKNCDRASICLGALAAERDAALLRAAGAQRTEADGSPLTRVAVFSDYPIVRGALRVLIDRRKTYQAILETALCPYAVQYVTDLGIDVALVDLDLTGSSEEQPAGLQSLFAAAPELPVLILTADPDPDACHRAFQLGVRGLVLKSKPLDDLFEAIDRIRRGESWLEGPALEKLLRQTFRAGGPDPDRARIASLTRREREIVEVVASGGTNRQIGKQLFISEATVRHHLYAIFEKLGVSTRGELMVYAYRHQLADRSMLEPS
jgi:DNA-binding NarL/FixJ family response regulator